LPASFLASLVTTPNPWPVTAFARSGKRRASPAGSATWERYTQCSKSKGENGSSIPHWARFLDKGMIFVTYLLFLFYLLRRRLIWLHPTTCSFLQFIRRGRQWKGNYPGTFSHAIDGFPRSGNTFATKMFQLTQGDKFKLQSRTHNPLCIIRAIRLNKPVILLIREPEDVIISWHIATQESIVKIIADYVAFYDILSKHKDQLITVTFEELIGDFHKVIYKLNNKSPGEYRLDFDHSQMAIKTFREIDNQTRKPDGTINENTVARPSLDRDIQKSKLKSEIDSPQYHRAMMKAHGLYHKFSSDSE